MCGRAVRSVAHPEAVDLIDRHLTALWAGNPDVPSRARAHVGIAVAEIAANIVKHATKGLDRPVELVMCAHVRGDAVIVTFADDGIAAPDDLPSREMPHELDECGRGIPLARAALSLLDYRRLDGVNHWTLVSERF